MKDKIPGRLILKLTPNYSSAGLHRFNHTDCSAGEDTRRRLYIRIPEDNLRVRLAYCHNCGMSGFAQLRRDSWVYDKGNSWNDTQSPFSILKNRSSGDPPKLISDYNLFPSAAQKLLDIYGLRTDTIVPTGGDVQRIAFDNESQRLAYINHAPTKGWDMISVQFRAIYKDVVPKYYTWYNPLYSTHNPQIIPSVKKDTIVITEDLISALRIRQDTLTSALPLFGTNISLEHLH